MNADVTRILKATVAGDPAYVAEGGYARWGKIEADISKVVDDMALLAREGMRLACVKVLTDRAGHCHPEEAEALIELADRMAAL